jgi:hypothetical protein
MPEIHVCRGFHARNIRDGTVAKGSSAVAQGTYVADDPD